MIEYIDACMGTKQIHVTFHASPDLENMHQRRNDNPHEEVYNIQVHVYITVNVTINSDYVNRDNAFCGSYKTDPYLERSTY